MSNKNDVKASVHVIFGVCNTKDICDGFKYEFAQNYIDSWNDDALCDKVYNIGNDLLNVHANDKCTSFTHADIKPASDKLKCSKPAGLDGLYVKHVKYAPSFTDQSFHTVVEQLLQTWICPD